jgi:hypothetical protein
MTIQASIRVLGEPDLFLYMCHFMNPRSIPRLGMTCKAARFSLISAEYRGGFKKLHFAAGIPGVEGNEYNCRNYVVLAVTELFDRQIRADYQYIGDPVGPTPLVKKAQIEVLCQNDPHCSWKKKYSTYRGVIIFSAVTRIFGKDMLATLDEKNQLTIKKKAPESIDSEDMDVEEQKLTIPMSTPNLIELFIHPIKNEKDNTVFSYVDFVDLDYPTKCEENSSITFVERKVPENSRNKSPDQRQADGAPTARFLSLMIPCGFDILKTGICAYVPTGTHKFTYACTSTIILSDGVPVFLTLGGYRDHDFHDGLFGQGISVHTISNGAATDRDGAISEIPAEVLPLML